MTVGGGDEGAVGEAFETGVRAVGAFMVLHEMYSALAGAVGGDVFVVAEPGDPIAFGGAVFAGVAEGDEELFVLGIDGDVAVAGEVWRDFAGRGPGLAFVVGECHERVEFAAVFAEEHGDLLAVGGAEEAGFAEVGFGVFGDGDWLLPGLAVVCGNSFVDGEAAFFGGRFLEEAAVVVKDGHIVSVLQLDDGRHGDDAAEVADGGEGRPRGAVVVGDGRADGVEAGEDNQAIAV